MKRSLLIFVVILAQFAIKATFASEIVAATSAKVDPGGAYDSNHQAFLGQCIAPKYHLTGSEGASGQFTLQNDQTMTENQLGFSAGAKARFGLITTTAEARFLKATKSNDFSVSAVWVSDYTLLSYKIDYDAQLTDPGSAALSDPARWAQLCGNEYVDEITRGAKLFFSIRIDFASKEVKEEFQAKFKIADPTIGSAEGALQKASSEFSKQSRITISALQIGGDSSKFTQIFPDTIEGRLSFVSCSLGEFHKCQDVIQSALKYAVDTKTGFPSQLSDKSAPNHVVYRTSLYSAHGIFPPYSSEMTASLEKVRTEVHTKFEQELTTASLIDSLLAIDVVPQRKQRLLAEQKKSDDNLRALAAAGNVCYTDFKRCVQAHDSLALQEINIKALELPPSPIASMRFMGNTGEISSRYDSVRMMNYLEQGAKAWVFNNFSGGLSGFKQSNKGKHVVIPEGYLQEGGTYPSEMWVEIDQIDSSNGVLDFLPPSPNVDRRGVVCNYTNYYKDQFLLAMVGSGSIILYIEGSVLSEATLWFDGRLIRKLVLNTAERKGDGRYGDTFAAVVVSTNRANVGWWDVNLDKEALDLSKSMPKGDGKFYITVKDGFGREARFDIEYVSWDVQTELLFNENRIKKRRTYLHKRNQWWESDSSGASLAETGAWSTNGTAIIYIETAVQGYSDFK
jgi:hypothetical protein